jgi:hypothetical protein
MAYDDRYERERERSRGPGWRGDDSFGGGWGNQTARPQRLGDRDRRPYDDPEYGAERYGPGAATGYGAGYGLTGDAEGFPITGGTGAFGVHPASSPFAGGVTPGGGYASSARAFAEIGRQGHVDPHYAAWRNRQIDALDRDYDEYRRENQARFDREFGACRERRGQQRQAVGRVTENMEVIGSDDAHVGTVDATSGDSIILTRSDPDAGGVHHRIPCGWVDSVDDKVKLNLTAADAMDRWREEADRVRNAPHFEAMFGEHGDPISNRALFEPERTTRGPHILNRSFAGTYREADRGRDED